MKIELIRFKVKQGKTERVNEWMKLLRDNLPAVLQTLDGEKMYVEAIFREIIKQEEFLYWFSIQGEGGILIQDSKHEIDKKHKEFSRECIDKHSPEWKKNITLEVAMIPERIKDVMQ